MREVWPHMTGGGGRAGNSLFNVEIVYVSKEAD